MCSSDLSVGAGVVVDEDGLVAGGGDVEIANGSGVGGLDGQDHHAEATSVSGRKHSLHGFSVLPLP